MPMFQWNLLQELVDIFCFLEHLHGIQRLISSNQDQGFEPWIKDGYCNYWGYGGLCMYVELVPETLY